MADTDAELTGRALAGSEGAARELVRRYERPVFNLIVRIVANPALAEDLAQDTFVKAFTRLTTYDSTCKFSNWILKIAHNTAIDHLRRPHPPTASFDGDDSGRGLDSLASTTAGPHLLAERSELAAAFDAAIGRLRPEYREVVILRYQEEFSYEEIAEVLDLPIGTVKSYLHRARAELAEAMRAAGWGGCNMEPAVSVGQKGRS